MLCEACLANDNYRFAYGCTGPCDNASAVEVVEAVASIQSNHQKEKSTK